MEHNGGVKVEHQEVHKESLGTLERRAHANATGASGVVVALCMLNLHFSASIYFALSPVSLFKLRKEKRGAVRFYADGERLYGYPIRVALAGQSGLDVPRKYAKS